MSGVVTASLMPVRRVARRHDEDDLQRAVMVFLDWSLPPDAVAFAVPNGGKRGKREAARMRGMGVKAGIPDICVIHSGRVAFIELKARRGVMSPAQKDMTRRLVYCRTAVFMCKSVDEVDEALRTVGVQLRTRLA